MTKVYFSNRRSAAVASSHQGHWRTAALAGVVCCTLLAVTHGADQVDSGWAVGVPSPFAKAPSLSDSHQQMILRKVLDQPRPLLHSPSPRFSAQTTTEASTPANASPLSSPSEDEGAQSSALTEGKDSDSSPNELALRVASRPESVDGWRVLGKVSTFNESVASQEPAAQKHSGPDLGAPASSTSNNDEIETIDSNGDSEATEQTSERETASPLADDYDNVPTDEGSASEEVEGAATAEAEAADSTDTVVTATDKPSSEGAVKANNANDAGSAATSVESTKSGAAEKATVPAPVEATPPPPLTRQLMGLRSRVRSVLKGYSRKMLNSRENDPWEVMHGMLSYGIESRVRQGGPHGEPITAVGWLCYNKPCKGQTLLYVNPSGGVRAKYGVGLQGHLGQLLAMLAQCHVSPDYPIRVGRNEFTIHDLIEAEKKTCYPKSELTFKLIALQHYIDLDDKWVNDQGLEWDFPRLMREEMAQPIRGAACGGTHRLSGLSLTVKTRLRRGEPLDGEYAEAAEFVKRYQQYAFRLQNRDGSLSTSWFRGAGDESDIDRRIKTTGHILEWLCYSLSDEELREQRTIRAVWYLSTLMYSNYDHDWEIGPRSHAIHALLLYDERVFQPFDRDEPVANYQAPSHVARSDHSYSTK